MNEKGNIEAVNTTGSPDMSEMMQGVGMMLMSQLPPVRCPEITTEDIRIPMPDGITLEAKLSKPAGDGAWPVVLIRNPYVSGTLLHGNLSLPMLARYGYAGLFVSVRGALGSEGEWLPMQHEKEDGRAVVDWIAAQPWCDGNIGSMGESYLGATQLAIADYDHPALKTHYIGVMGGDAYHLFWRRGMFKQEVWSAWASQMMGENRRRMILPQENFDLFWRAMKHSPSVTLGEELIGEHCDWYEDWATNASRLDAYWNEDFWEHLTTVCTRMRRPVFFEGGWFDIFLRSGLDGWRKMRPEVRAKSRFLIGPRGHNGAMQVPGADRAGMFSLRAAIAWFDYMLKGMPYDELLGVVDVYNLGANAWTSWEDDISGTVPKTYYLQKPAEGICGALTETPVTEEQTQEYLYDPEHPAETRGGQILANFRQKPAAEMSMESVMAEMSVDQGPVGERTDVLYYESAPFAEDVTIAGSMEAGLYVASDCPATSFTVKVMEVKEDGSAMILRDDITDIRWLSETDIEDYVPGDVRLLKLDILDICWTFAAGSKLRVDISSSNFPQFHIHPNVTDCWARTTEKQIAHQTVYTGGEHTSYITLPVAE